MGAKETLYAGCRAIVATEYDPRDGRVIPSVQSVALSDGAVRIDAAVMYADLADSTGLVDRCEPSFAADVTRVFLYAASQCIKRAGGTITSFDGDRVMGVFMGEAHVERSARAALGMAAAVQDVVLPAISTEWKVAGAPWTFNYGIGLDASPITVIRAGVVGDNDLVWLGSAANHAAALSGRREGAYKIYASNRFVKALSLYRINGDGTSVWSPTADGAAWKSQSRLSNLDAIGGT